jgi:hypothetical protein
MQEVLANREFLKKEFESGQKKSWDTLEDNLRVRREYLKRLPK